MPNLLDQLRAFNRKERYLLIGHALGNPQFRLSDGFSQALHEAP